jgi:signal transduction histidine kinase
MVLEAAWDEFARNVSKLIAHDRLVLALYHPENNTLRNEFESGLTVSGLPMNEEVPLEGSIGGAVISTGEAVLENSVGPGFISRFPASHAILPAGIGSVMAFALVSGRSVVGVLHIQSRKSGAYRRRDVAVGRAIAALAGGTFGSLRLISRLESRMYDLSQSGAERQVLTDIAALVSSSLDVSDVYAPFCEKVGQLIPWDRIVVQTLNDDETVTDRFWAGVDERPPNATVSLQGTLAADAISHRRTYRLSLANQRETDAALANYPVLKRAVKLGQRSVMVLPLIVGDRVIGVLHFACREAGAYTEKHQQFAEQIALSVAYAIRNADLHQEVKLAADDRERLVESDVRASELERRAGERAAFLSQLSHELKTPLTSVGLFAELLHRGMERQDDSKSDGHLDGILRNIRRMERLIGDLLDVSAMETGQLGFQHSEIDISEILIETIADFEPYAELRDQVVHLDIPDNTPVTVWADRERIAQAISILLDNACKYSGVQAEIWIRLERSGGSVTIEVEDTGPGLRREDVDRIFDRFYRGEGSSGSAAGTGLGLHMARAIVEAHDGTIRADRERPIGARFTVELPVGTPEV